MAHEDTLKNNWGLNSGTEKSTKTAAATAEVEADERLRERRRAALATGVNPETITADNDPAVVKKAGNPQTTLAQRLGFKSNKDNKRSVGTLQQALGDQSKR